MISAVIAVVIGLTVWTNEEDDEGGPVAGWVGPEITPQPLEDDALTWFYEDSVGVLADAKRTIEMVNRGEEQEEIERKSSVDAVDSDERYLVLPLPARTGDCWLIPLILVVLSFFVLA